jgi:DNA-binding MarR family transcriptional regulator
MFSLTLSAQHRGFVGTSGGRLGAPIFVRKDLRENKQIELVESTLTKYGLSESEAKAYLYLAMAGERKASEIAQAISLHRTEVYRILRDLEKKGIVIEAFEAPLKFAAVPLNRAIVQLLDAQRLKIDLLDKERTELIQLWDSMPKPKIQDTTKEMFQMLEGGPQVLLKAKELLENAEKEVKIFVPDDHLALLYSGDFFGRLEQRSFDVNIRLLTEDSLKSRLICEQLGWAAQCQLSRDVENLPCFILTDRTMLLTIYRKESQDKNQHRMKTKVGGLLTNCSALVESMLELFSHLDEQKRETEEV